MFRGRSRFSHSIVLCAFTLVLAACAKKTPAPHRIPIHAAETEIPLFALWCNEGMPNPSNPGPEPGVVVAAWQNGRVVVSRNAQSGGAPYAEKRIDPMLIRSVCDRARNALQDLDESSGMRIADSRSSRILVSGIEGNIVVSTAHESAEWNPNLIATDRGIETLDGRDREHINATQSREFRALRKAWKEAAEAIRSLLDSSLPTSDTDPIRYEWKTL